jgi:MoxR-like ATPase
MDGLSRLHDLWQQIRAELGRVVVGHDTLIEQLLICVLSQGHCLVVGLPGVAKATAASALARVLGLDFHRLRCSPDLGPDDVTESGPSARKGEGRVSGLLFANLLLVDGVDRLAPKTANVLHQALQDREVTVRGQRRSLPNPFMVLATKHPADDDAPEAPVEPGDDRFMFEIRVPYPSYHAEYEMAETTTANRHVELPQILSAAEILVLQHEVRKIPAPAHTIHYAVRLVRSTRVHEGENPDFVYEWVSRGAGPRAVQCLTLAAKVRAGLYGRPAVEIGDVRAVAHAALRHRVITNRNARSNGVDSDRVISRLLEDIPERLNGDDAPPGPDDVIDPGQWTQNDVLGP